MTTIATRRARIERRTKESDIVIELDLDGTGQVHVWFDLSQEMRS